MCKFVCAPILLRPSPQEIVLGRLRGRIRRLFDVGAGIRVEMRGGLWFHLNRAYIAIEPKSFCAAVECRTGKTLCLAVTPSRKSCGISGRGRLFDRIVDRNLLVRCTENAFRCLWVTYSLFVGWIFCGKRAILFYVVLYNRMMAYVEHHAYPNSDNEERDEK